MFVIFLFVQKFYMEPYLLHKSSLDYGIWFEIKGLNYMRFLKVW